MIFRFNQITRRPEKSERAARCVAEPGKFLKMRRQAKKDDNHDAIVRDLLRLGFSVMETHQLGNYRLDAVVALRGITAIVEIKNPDTNGKLSKGQSDFFESWQGMKIVAYCTDDILRAFGLI